MDMKILGGRLVFSKILDLYFDFVILFYFLFS